MHKIKQWTGRGTTSMSLSEVVQRINPILRGWAEYFRYGDSRKTFSSLTPSCSTGFSVRRVDTPSRYGLDVATALTRVCSACRR
ncbi:group II intron maturase-specific domain-containing protein [Actinoplanes rectilineatus]|uniref:group II intron maturase-specific domain-containing protein n=1 Tax=Actinoplanes rectilineatus TaxID=113571 RepID=UPI001B7FF1CB